VVFRPVRDAPPIDVRMVWRRHDPHPSTHATVALLAGLYRGGYGSRQNSLPSGSAMTIQPTSAG
jgi:hypothetical protein